MSDFAHGKRAKTSRVREKWCVCLQVFGTDVMVTVAKSFEAPIKCEY